MEMALSSLPTFGYHFPNVSSVYCGRGLHNVLNIREQDTLGAFLEQSTMVRHIEQEFICDSIGGSSEKATQITKHYASSDRKKMVQLSL